MWDAPLLPWQQRLLGRLEHDMGRPMVAADRTCLVWNETVATLTVQSAPLLLELRSRNLVSNVFRSRAIRA